MALNASPPLVVRGGRGKGPRTKRQRLIARERARLEGTVEQPPRRRPTADQARDDNRTLDLGSLGRAVYRPGALHDPRTGRPVL